MMLNSIQVAIYARVSSEQQTDAHTINSQLSALTERVVADGLQLLPEYQFVDEGFSGATLVRPGLERLRDAISAGGVERLYVHSPDRLARKYAYQVLLVDEFQRAGVEVVFLNRKLGGTPEDELLLQVQGMVAEYERAKIMERSRRGKRHAAQMGVINVLSGAPYGYRYVSKQEGGGQARYEVLPEQAQVVRQIFTWIGQERATIGEVCRRLQQAGVLTQTGKTAWDRSTVWGMLRNPAYKGAAAFGKTKVGPMRPQLRAGRGQSLQPRRAYSIYPVEVQDRTSIPVPAIVDTELFEVVQQQLEENQRRARQGQRGARYLLQGLLVCKCCGYSYYGKPVNCRTAKGKSRHYAYYRCIGSDAYRFGGQRVCQNTQVRTDRLEQAVWVQVQALLEDPQRLEQEYQRRSQVPSSTQQQTIVSLEAQIAKLRRGIGRLIDSYAEGLIDKPEFDPRIRRLKERVANLETQVQSLHDEEKLHQELRLIIGRVEEFAAKVKEGLEQVDWQAQREIIRTLVKRIEIDHEQVNVVFRVKPTLTGSEQGQDCLQHCRRRNDGPLGHSLVGKYQTGFGE
ncbi:MAG: recombinase family protein [Cyanobacteria bacterium P01_G01_bin.4]